MTGFYRQYYFESYVLPPSPPPPPGAAGFVSPPPMPSVQDVAGCRCAKILVPLIFFLGGPSLRNPAVDEAIVHLIVVLSMGYFAGVIVERFAGVVLAYLHLAAAPAPAASSACPGRFVGPFFRLVSAWFLLFAALLAAFVFLRAGMPGTGFSWNVLG